MRRFIVIGHEAPIDPTFSLDDLPGTAGRLDVLCACVSAALLRSHAIRDESEIVAIHQDELSVRFSGEAIRNVRPDERSTEGRFQAALRAAENAIGAVEVEASPGVSVSRLDLEDVLARSEGTIVHLDPRGDPLPTLDPTDDLTCILSDHHAFTDADVERIDTIADRRLSVGPLALHAAQAITVVHNYLDTDGFRTYAP